MGKEIRSLYRGLHYIEVRYIEVPALCPAFTNCNQGGKVLKQMTIADVTANR